MTTINNPKRVEINNSELVKFVREAVAKKYPQLADEEFEIRFLREGGYTCEPYATIDVVV